MPAGAIASGINDLMNIPISRFINEWVGWFLMQVLHQNHLIW